MTHSIRLGIFVAFALAAAATAIFLIGSNTFLFANTYHLYALFTNVAGLRSGASVNIAGLQEGAVTRIYLPAEAGQPMRVEMKLKKGTQRIVKLDSHAVILTQGLVGDQYIEISIGTRYSPSVRNGDTIRGVTPPQLSDLVSSAQAALENANRTFGSMNGLIATADGAMGKISAAAGNLDSITSKIDKGQGTLGAMLNNPSIYQHFDQVSGDLASITGKLNSGKGTLGALLNDPSAYRSLNQAVGNLASITGKLNSGQGSLGALLTDPSAYQHFNQAAGNLADITAKLNSGQGTLGAMLNDPSAYQHFTAAAGSLDSVMAKINSGQGSLGQLVNNPSMYDNLNRTAANFQDDSEALKHTFFLRGFFKHRGYQNQSDLVRYSIPQPPAAPVKQRFEIPGAAVFKNKNNAYIKHGDSLDAVGAYLQSHPFSMVVVKAESGMEGNTDTQRTLTDARAYAARQWLVDHYPLDDTRIKTFGAGKTHNVPASGRLSILVYGEGVATSSGVAERSARTPGATGAGGSVGNVPAAGPRPNRH